MVAAALLSPTDAFARGGGGLILLFPIIAVIVVAIVPAWLLASFTVVPIGMGIYLLATGANTTALVIGSLLLAFGLFHSWWLLPESYRQRVKKVLWSLKRIQP